MTREAPGNTESLGADPSDLRCFSARRESDAGLWGPPGPKPRNTPTRCGIPGGLALTKLTGVVSLRRISDAKRDIRRVGGEWRCRFFSFRSSRRDVRGYEGGCKKRGFRRHVVSCT